MKVMGRFADFQAFQASLFLLFANAFAGCFFNQYSIFKPSKLMQKAKWVRFFNMQCLYFQIFCSIVALLLPRIFIGVFFHSFFSKA
jgi:hypothetical protein